MSINVAIKHAQRQANATNKTAYVVIDGNGYAVSSARDSRVWMLLLPETDDWFAGRAPIAEAA